MKKKQLKKLQELQMEMLQILLLQTQKNLEKQYKINI